MSITVGKYNFDGPYTDVNQLMDRSGVYVILCANGNNNYSVIDVGESGAVKSRVENHDRASCWKGRCSTSLSAAVLYTHETNRMLIERELRHAYSPPCGVM